MKIIANKPNEDQSYKNNFKENGIYPFSKITRVITDKKTGQILQVLNENDSNFDRDFIKKSIFDETKHDIMCMFPKFYYRRNWEDEELEDCIVTDIPPEHINFIPENILDKSIEVFPCFVREDGSIRDYVLYSAFEGSIVDGQLRSIPNEEVVVDKTLGELREFARSERDEKFNLENMSVIAMIQFLYKIGFQDLNSQKVLGKGWVKKQSKTKTGGTLKLGNRSGYQDPFVNSPDKPDDRISLSFRAGENGELAMYNTRTTDPMPIKTINMAGLQKWEETEDYIIYLDKDAIMTTVEKYAPGAYQKFQETQALINSNDGLLKEYSIDWVNKDDADLFIQINNDEVAKIESQPMMLPVDGEEPTQPVVLKPKTVPTTYECCFRMDKKSEEFYIGEGYENLFGLNKSFSKETYGCFYEWDYEYITFSTTRPIDSGSRLKITGLNRGIIGVDRLTVTAEKGDIFPIIVANSAKEVTYIENGFISIPTGSGFGVGLISDMNGLEFTNEKVKFKNLQITKTSTPKPFVKSIMPDGKLTLITNSNFENKTILFDKERKREVSNILKGFKLIAESNPIMNIIKEENTIWIGDNNV